MNSIVDQAHTNANLMLIQHTMYILANENSYFQLIPVHTNADLMLDIAQEFQETEPVTNSYECRI